jgi:hypothetical protein
VKRFGLVAFIAAFFSVIIALTALAPLPHVAGQNNVQFQLSNIVGTTDPCQNLYTIKTTVPLAEGGQTQFKTAAGVGLCVVSVLKRFSKGRG